MIKKIVIITILITSFVSSSGCLNQSHNGNPEDMILGSWKRMNYDLDQTWQFKQDGTMNISGLNYTITYWFENNSLFTYFPSLDYLDAYTYQFNGDNELLLTLKPGTSVIIDPNTGDPVEWEPYEIVLQRL